MNYEFSQHDHLTGENTLYENGVSKATAEGFLNEIARGLSAEQSSPGI